MTDFRYEEQAEKELSAGNARSLWDICIEKGDRYKMIKGFAESPGIRTVGFESGAPYDFFQRLSRGGMGLKPLKRTVETLRAVKDASEVSSLREAVRRAEAAFLDVKPHIRSGRHERQIALMLEERLKKRGCNHLPFDIIVASGANAALPHARAGDKKLSPGNLLVVDWGGEADGYCSDMTRTFLVGPADPGSGSAARKNEIARLVFEANRRAIASVRPGVKGKFIDNAARDVIKKAGYGKSFGHGTGHGVGLEVHEAPGISWSGSSVVRENMVFTIEPGIYIPGLGGVRIEDMVLVKSGKTEVLTKLPRRLEIL